MTSTATSRGTIIKVPDSTPGLVIVNGTQKSFTLERVWRAPVAPAANMTVDVELNDRGDVAGIIAVDSQQLAKEKFDKLGGLAEKHGKEAAEIAKQGVGALATRMGMSALIATVVLWVAWFFLPAVKLDFFLLNRSFSFWEYLAMSMNNPQSPTGSRGILGLLGVLCLVAPVARPFIQHAKAKYLNAAPLAFILVAPLLVYWRLAGGIGPAGEPQTLAELQRGVQREAAKAMLDSLSISWFGALVLVIPAAFLAMKAFKKDAQA
jgi:hypothetical protein